MSEAEEKETQECPFCRETIVAGARKCKYCGSKLGEDQPSHGGQCPYCKEAIDPEAVKCPHCRSFVGPLPKEAGGCGCRGDVKKIPFRQGFPLTQHAAMSSATGMPWSGPFGGGVLLPGLPGRCWWECASRCCDQFGCIPCDCTVHCIPERPSPYPDPR